MTPEMLNFHQVISELQTAEDNMLDNHKQTIEQLHNTIQKFEKILKVADDVTYDQEGTIFISISNLIKIKVVVII